MNNANRTLSLANLTIIDAHPLELIEAARRGGMSAIGLRLRAGNPIPMACEIVGNAAVLREIRAALADAGLSVLDTEACALFPDVEPEAFVPMLDTAAELGATFVNVTGCDDDIPRMTERFARLCELARERNLRVALEFLPYRSVRTLADARSMLECAGQSNAGILIDALHLSRSGGSPADVAALPAGLVTHLQLCDAVATIPSFEDLPSEARTGRLYPGDGALWLDALVGALPAGLPVAVEAPVAADCALDPVARGVRAAQALRSWLERTHAARA